MFLQPTRSRRRTRTARWPGLQTTVQRLGWFQQQWDVGLPDNFADDYQLQPLGVQHYKEIIDLNYGRIPDDRDRPLAGAAQLPDQLHAPGGRRVQPGAGRAGSLGPVEEHGRDLHQRPRRDERRAPHDPEGRHPLRRGGHRRTSPSARRADRRGSARPPWARTSTWPDPAGVRRADRGGDPRALPAPQGAQPPRSVSSIRTGTVRAAARARPAMAPSFCWDGLHFLDKDWAITGALQELTDMGPSGPDARRAGREERLRESGQEVRRARLQQAHVLPRGRRRPVQAGALVQPGGIWQSRHARRTVRARRRDPARSGKRSRRAGKSGSSGPPGPRPGAGGAACCANSTPWSGPRSATTARPFDLDLFGTREVTYPKEKNPVRGKPTWSELSSRNVYVPSENTSLCRNYWNKCRLRSALGMVPALVRQRTERTKP